MTIVTIQKENTRYTLAETNHRDRIQIKTEQCFATGCSVTWRYVTISEANAFYVEMLRKGFKRFRNIGEVSWYATVENNTPFEEKWGTEGIWFVPIESRVRKQL